MLLKYKQAAFDCSSLSIVRQSSSCNLGMKLADTETMVKCAATLCGEMGTLDKARGADGTMRLVGSGYGCYVAQGNDANDKICMPNNTTPAVQAPTPPPPAPTPPPSVPCSSLSIVRQSSSCNSGMKPADTETMVKCAATLCGEMGTLDKARGADGTMRLVGSGYGCYVAQGNDANDKICMPNNTTPAVQAPTPPPPAPTPPPSVPCSSLSIVKQSSSCNLGWTPADTKTMVACAATLCGEMGTLDKARGADRTMRLVGSGYGCYVAQGNDANHKICMPNNTTPAVQAPTPPPPAPTPPPSVPCSSLSIVRQSSSCNSGMKLADTETMVKCAATLCGEMGTLDKARGADGTMRLVGSGYGCYVAQGNDANHKICMPNNTTPAVQAPTPPPPAPTPPPSVPCSSLSIVKQSSSCNLGWTPADTKTMVACAATLCGKMGTLDKARGADRTMRLVGSGYGCYVAQGNDANDMICMPSHLISK